MNRRAWHFPVIATVLALGSSCASSSPVRDSSLLSSVAPSTASASPDGGVTVGVFERRTASWTGSGRMVAVPMPHGKAHAFSMAGEGRARTWVSPDGRFVAQVRSDDVGPDILSVGAADDLPLLKPVLRETLRVESVIWMPGGDSLLYIGARDDTGTEDGEGVIQSLFSIGRDGTHRRLIATLPPTTEIYEYRDLVAVRNGRYALWFRGIGDGAGPHTDGLFETDLTTGKTVAGPGDPATFDIDYADSTEPVVSTDGERLYFVRDEKTLVEMSLATGEKRTLFTSSELLFDQVCASVDGEWIVFDLAQDGMFSDDGRTVVYRLRLDDLSTSVVFERARWDSSELSLAPDGRYVWFAASSDDYPNVVIDAELGKSREATEIAGQSKAYLFAWVVQSARTVG